MALYPRPGSSSPSTNPPILLIIIILVQATVYLCAPIAALWNLRAQRVPAEEYRRRFDEQRQRLARRPARSFATVGFAGALFLAVAGRGRVAVFAAPAQARAGPGRRRSVPRQAAGTPRPVTPDAQRPRRQPLQQAAAETVVAASRQ